MACKHDWKGSGPCPDCLSVNEVAGLLRDAAALGCVNAAAKLLLAHGTTFTAEELAVTAYELGDALMLERAKKTTVAE